MSKRSKIIGNLKVINNKIIELIDKARENAIRKVNEELINLYWNVGEYLYIKSKAHNWGDNFIDEVAVLKKNALR